jgi:hypothetical protein
MGLVEKHERKLDIELSCHRELPEQILCVV